MMIMFSWMMIHSTETKAAVAGGGDDGHAGVGEPDHHHFPQDCYVQW